MHDSNAEFARGGTEEVRTPERGFILAPFPFDWVSHETTTIAEFVGGQKTSCQKRTHTVHTIVSFRFQKSGKFSKAIPQHCHFELKKIPTSYLATTPQWEGYFLARYPLHMITRIINGIKSSFISSLLCMPSPCSPGIWLLSSPTSLVIINALQRPCAYRKIDRQK